MANSKPWLDLELRETYRTANPYDEIARYFPVWDRGWTRIPGDPATIVRALDTPAAHVHHIGWGHGGNRRWDRTWNFLALSWYSHTFVHAYPIDGLAMCLHAKIKKGEWDAAAAKETLGMNLVGYLYVKSCEHDFAEVYRMGLIDGDES